MNRTITPIIRYVVSLLSQNSTLIRSSTFSPISSHNSAQHALSISTTSNFLQLATKRSKLQSQSSRALSSLLIQQHRTQQQQLSKLTQQIQSKQHYTQRRPFSTQPSSTSSTVASTPTTSTSSPPSSALITSSTPTPNTTKGNVVSQFDERLVQITSASSARIKSKFPKGKVIFLTVAIVGLYVFLQKKIRAKTAHIVGQQYINTIDLSQIESLQGIGSLSREDIMHVFQWLQTEMTNNGMLETDTISSQLHDEIDDGRDDRKLEKQRYVGLYQIFQFEAKIHFTKDELIEIIPKLNALHNQLQLTFIGLEFDPVTNDIVNPQQYSSQLTPLEDLLAPGDNKRKEIYNQIDEISREQKQTFLRSDLSAGDRSTALSRLQEQIEILQHDQDVIKQEQLLIRSHYHSQVQTLSPEQQLIADYHNLKKLFDRKNKEIEMLMKGLNTELEKLPPDVQDQIQQYRQENEAGTQHISTTETIFNMNYYSPDNDEYKTNPWTWLLFFRNQPTGVAGDTRFIKYSDALIALSVLAKTKWNPADPHHIRYMDPKILRQYGLDVQKAFTDYTADPLCIGGEITLAPLKDNGELNLHYENLSEIKAPELSGFDRFKGALGLDIKPAMDAYQLKLDTFNHYRQLHSLEINSTLPPDQQSKSVKYEQVYTKPLEHRIEVLGRLFKRANPNCQWDIVPDDIKVKIAERFEFLRKRQSSQYTNKYDTNPKQTLSLAWASQFAPEPLQDTPHARNQYRRALGDFKSQTAAITKAFEVTENTKLSRVQFEKLIKSMANSGHFNVESALLTRTNWLWPIQYHTTSHQVIAQAYYDCIGKSTDDEISLEEFDRAARYWGKVGKYDLWYYAPTRQGEDIPGIDIRTMKFREFLPRVMYSLGFGDYFCHSSRNPEGPLCNYVELSNRYTKQLSQDSSSLLQQKYTPHNPLSLAQFSAHSKNVSERHIHQYTPPEDIVTNIVSATTSAANDPSPSISTSADTLGSSIDDADKKSKKKRRTKREKSSTTETTATTEASTTETTSTDTPVLVVELQPVAVDLSAMALSAEAATTAAV